MLPLAYRAELHLHDRMMAIATLRCRGQPHEVASLDCRNRALMGNSGYVMAFVDNDVPIRLDEVRDIRSTRSLRPVGARSSIN